VYSRLLDHYLKLTSEEERQAFINKDYESLVRSQLRFVEWMARRVCSYVSRADLRNELVSAGLVHVVRRVPKYDGSVRLTTYIKHGLSTYMIREAIFLLRPNGLLVCRQGRNGWLEWLDHQCDSLDDCSVQLPRPVVVDLDRRWVFEVLKSLKINNRDQFIVLWQLYGYTFEEIASTLNMSRQGVHQRYARVMKKLMAWVSK